MEKCRIVLHFKPLERGVAEVEGKGEGGCFASLDGAGEEVNGKDFHRGSFGSYGEVIFSCGPPFSFFFLKNTNASKILF